MCLKRLHLEHNGSVVKSYAIYFQQQYIPEDRLQETVRDLFNIDLVTAISEFDADALSKIKTNISLHAYLPLLFEWPDSAVFLKLTFL